MEKAKTETTNNKELELKTLEDVDKTTENNAVEENTEKSDIELENEKLKTELATYKEKYTKAVEVNNQLYQRLTSQKPVEKSALQGILDRF